MDEAYTNLSTNHLLGPVPAVIVEDRKDNDYRVPDSNLQIFPPTNARDSGWGYQAPGISPGEEEQTTSTWKGVFSISSYRPYFNVDTDIVLDRMKDSLFPNRGNFFNKIDENPDLYGPLWISTTLVFMLSALGNCATYLIERKSEKSAWNFDVSYVNWATCSIYGYVLLVPAIFYFLLQYFGSRASLIRLWCMWGYSLFIFILSSVLLLIPLEFFRWITIILVGSASSCFVALNMKSYLVGNDLTILVISSLVLQFALSIFIKVCFFP